MLRKNLIAIGLLALGIMIPSQGALARCWEKEKQSKFVAIGIYITSSQWPDCSSLETFYADVCRLEQARTDEEKAIALMRWLPKLIKAGPACTNNIEGLNRTLALLNVYGFTDTNEMAEVSTQIWRVAEGKPAHRVYLPRYNYTTTHLWYEDVVVAGGAEPRYHWFDYAHGTFLYMRVPWRLADATDLLRDPSLHSVPSKGFLPLVDRQDTRGWVRLPNTDVAELYTARNYGISLVASQSLELHWTDKIDFKRERLGDNPSLGWLGTINTFGEGKKSGYSALGKRKRYSKGQGARTQPNGIVTYKWTALKQDETGPGRLAATFPSLSCGAYGMICEGVANYKVVSLGPEGGIVTFFISITGDSERKKLKQFKIEGYTVQNIGLLLGAAAPPGNAGAAIHGRHTGFSIDTEIELATTNDIITMDSINSLLLVHHNPLSLPALKAGVNKIKVRGRYLHKDWALRITYVWETQYGQFGHVAVVETLPYEYVITTDVPRGSDVVCEKLLCEVVPANKEAGNRVEKKDLVIKRNHGLMTAGSRSGRNAFERLSAPELKPEEEYIVDLASDDIRTKLHAARTLAGIATEKSFDALVPYLKDETVSSDDAFQQFGALRSWLIDAIGNTGHPKAVEELLLMLEDVSGWDWCAVVVALGQQEDKRAVEPLLKMYDASEGPRRWIILQALGVIKDERAIALMEKELFHEDIRVAAAAAHGLRAMPRRESLEPLFKAAENRDGGVVRICAVQMAGKFREAEYEEQLRGFLGSDPDELVRGWSARALGEMEQDYEVNFLAVQGQLNVERSPWAREMMEAALKKLAEHIPVVE